MDKKRFMKKKIHTGTIDMIELLGTQGRVDKFKEKWNNTTGIHGDKN